MLLSINNKKDFPRLDKVLQDLSGLVFQNTPLLNVLKRYSNNVNLIAQILDSNSRPMVDPTMFRTIVSDANDKEISSNVYSRTSIPFDFNEYKMPAPSLANPELIIRIENELVLKLENTPVSKKDRIYELAFFIAYRLLFECAHILCWYELGGPAYTDKKYKEMPPFSEEKYAMERSDISQELHWAFGIFPPKRILRPYLRTVARYKYFLQPHSSDNSKAALRYYPYFRTLTAFIKEQESSLVSK